MKAKSVILTVLLSLSSLGFYFYIQKGRNAQERILDHLEQANEICEKNPFYYIHHSDNENRIYYKRIAKSVIKELQKILPLVLLLNDSSKVKEPIQLFLKNWTTEAIEKSLLTHDGKFISDIQYIFSLLPVRRKKQWKTLFPIAHP